MQRLLIAAYVLYAVNLLVVAPQTRVIVGVLAVLFATVLLVDAFFRRKPDHPLATFLYATRGPRTDVPFMSRAELFRSARLFAIWGALLTSVHVVFVARATPAFWDSPTLPALCSAFMLCGVSGLAGAAYLFIRGLFRRNTYRPPTHPLSPPGERNAA